MHKLFTLIFQKISKKKKKRTMSITFEKRKFKENCSIQLRTKENHKLRT